MSFAQLKEEVLKLSAEEKAELLTLLHAPEDDEWDKQMKEDAAAGLFDQMIERAEADMKAGRVRDLP